MRQWTAKGISARGVDPVRQMSYTSARGVNDDSNCEHFQVTKSSSWEGADKLKRTFSLLSLKAPVAFLLDMFSVIMQWPHACKIRECHYIVTKPRLGILLRHIFL